MLKTPATRLSLGLTLLTLSILSLGDVIGLVPDPRGETLLFRKRFAESLAIQLSYAAGQRDFAALRNTLEAVVERSRGVGVLRAGSIVSSWLPRHCGCASTLHRPCC